MRPTWRFTGTDDPGYTYTYNLLRGLRGLLGTAIVGVISAHEPFRIPKP